MRSVKKFSERQIKSLAEALRKAGFLKTILINDEMRKALNQFLDSDDPVKIRTVIGRLRVICPEFNLEVEPGTDFVTEKVRKLMREIISLNFPPQKKRISDFEYIAPYEIFGGANG